MNNIKKSRVHPLGILDFIISVLKLFWIFVILLLREDGLPRYLILAGICLILILWGVLNYLATTYEVADNVIIYREGIFNKKIKNINLENIQSLDTSSNILYQVFNLVSLDINLVADKIRIRPLKKDIALALIHKLNKVKNVNKTNINNQDIGQHEELGLIIEEKEEVKILSLSIKDLIFYGLLRVRFLAALGLLFAFYDKIKDVVKYIFDSSDIVDKYLEKGAKSAAGDVKLLITITLVFIVLVIIGSIIFTVTKFYNFTLLRKDNNLLCKYGLLNKKSLVIDIERLQSIKIKEPLRYRFFGLVKLSVETLTKTVSEDLSEQKTTIDLMPLVPKKEAQRFIEENLSLDLGYYNSLKGEKIPKRARFVMYRWSVINCAFLPLIIFFFLYMVKIPVLETNKIEIALVLYLVLLFYSLLTKIYKLKNNEIAYDNNNFKYTYMSGLEIITEFIKVKKVGTINKQTHYFLNRLNLVHLKINSIGNNSDINLRYYDKQYHLKLEKDFLEKETVYANNI